MQTAVEELKTKGARARKASGALAKLSSYVKDQALNGIADGLKARQEEILAANEQDLEAGRQAGLGDGLMDRLLLDPARPGGDGRRRTQRRRPA